jgi:hypothetical protein
VDRLQTEGVCIKQGVPESVEIGMRQRLPSEKISRSVPARPRFIPPVKVVSFHELPLLEFLGSIASTGRQQRQPQRTQTKACEGKVRLARDSLAGLVCRL